MTNKMGLGLLATSAMVLALVACGKDRTAVSSAGDVIDEATQAKVDDKVFVHADEDYFKGMDGGVALSADEVRGRNMWNVWTGGNDRFWDRMGTPTLGSFDLLKIVAPPMDSQLRRAMRWQWLGAVNEPCFSAATAPDAQRFGLLLDVRDPGCPADPFANEQKYPGVRVGSRGTTFADGTKMPVGSYYGWPTGILGLWLFPNTRFD